MNDGEEHAGFTLDSLLKLQSAKAFDKKTSVLQFVITLIYRNDENCLSFPDDLANVGNASRLVLGRLHVLSWTVLSLSCSMISGSADMYFGLIDYSSVV